MIIAIMAFCTSREKNRIQIIFTYWLIANTVPKRVIVVLNNIDIYISYDVGVKVMKAVGQVRLVDMRILI